MAIKSNSKADTYSNVINTTLTLSAANTLTFQEIDLGLTIFQKVAILIERADFFISRAVLAELQASADGLQAALTQSNQISDLSITESAVIDQVQLSVTAMGVPANGQVLRIPLRMDYTQLGGGGLLVVPKPLYFAGVTEGFAAAMVLTLRFYFRIVALKPDEYFELLESRRFFG